MRTELRTAITQLSAERNLPKEVVLAALESALASAYKKSISALATAQLGDVINIECTPDNIGRIAVQAAKQVVLQRLREAEHRIVYEEFTDREGNVVTGIIQFIEPKRIYVRLNRIEAVLPVNEQVHNEHYYRGQRLKFYILEMIQRDKEPQIIVSRSHPNLIRGLFEL
jgi:N utilization substance protein A